MSTGKSRDVKELKLLLEISRKLSESLDLKSVLRPILEMTSRHMGIQRGMLTILNRRNGEIVVEEAYGLRPEERAKGKYRMGEGITGRVIITGEPAIIPKISDEPDFLDKTGSRRHLDKSDIAFVCVPIKSGSEVIGALSTDRAKGTMSILEEDARLLTIIASNISQAVRLRQSAQEELDSVLAENRRLQDELRNRYNPDSIVGSSRIMFNLYRLIEQVSGTNATVLILGESGVGKERVAHAIHYASVREGPFVAVNCAALPESLIESELFGHEKGAFTGATGPRKGRFEMAEKGTIFLDEIGDIPLTLQTKLLRVLQEKTFQRVGGNATIKADVRIIAATNKNLEMLMKEGMFREDLYYRLNVFPIVVPPLREHTTDIMLLANHFVEKYSIEHDKKIMSISPEATDMLTQYNWPGNIRELENYIERAIILSNDGIIHSYHLPPNLQNREEGSEANVHSGRLKDILASTEKRLIIDELRRSNGNMAKAARALGLTERMIGLRIARFKIDPSHFRNSPSSAHDGKR
ncbi:MAG TPA: sigma 54-interacting transcriptional regulator [Syntrophorhabdaceae bacterium]|nr:sigma 54-interacting transcriptional regulator [Syntrophorhabdaceae bacterium]